MSTSSSSQANPNVDYLLKEYNEKKENVTVMNIMYGDHRVVREIALDQHRTHAHPTVEIVTPEENVYYTLVLVDADAPTKDSPSNSPFLHWIIGNFQGATIVDGHTICNYHAPKVGHDDKHRFIFLLYQSNEAITASPIAEQEQRRQFPLKQFVDENKLSLVSATAFSIDGTEQK